MELSLGDVLSRSTSLAGGRTEWATSEASFWANVALQEVSRQVWHNTLETLAYSSTTSGENRITLPTDFDAPIAISNVSTLGAVGGRQLRLVQSEWIDSQTTLLGEPEAYALFNDWLELWPSPDSSYSLLLRYRARHPTLTQSTQTPSFNERWHPGWLYKTAELLEAARGNPEGELLNRNRYINYMSSIPDDRALRQQAKTGMGMRFQRTED